MTNPHDIVFVGKLPNTISSRNLVGFTSHRTMSDKTLNHMIESGKPFLIVLRNHQRIVVRPKENQQ